MTQFNFNLGDLVECSMTNLKGRVMGLVKDIYSANRYVVQPPYNHVEGRMPNAITLDEPTLILIESCKDYPYIYTDGEFELGSLVEDSLFKKKGTIKDRRLNINGCYSVNLAFLNDKGETYTFSAQEKSLILIKGIKETGVRKESRETGCEMEENFNYN
jgi:hypothetical protein